MPATPLRLLRLSCALVALAGLAVVTGQPVLGQQDDSRFRFRTGVALVNVTVTVTAGTE